MNTNTTTRHPKTSGDKPRYQHRPQLRRQTTRRAATLAALREA